MEHLIQLFGRFHPLLVHLPIGIILLAAGMEFLARKPQYATLAPALPGIWGAGFLTALLSCVAGYFLKSEGGYEGNTIDLHQYLGISVAITSGIVFLSKYFGKLEKLRLPLAALSASLLLATGHLGGSLTHGEDFLTEPVVALLGKEAPQPITNIEEALVYQDLVLPVLEQKCYKCHSGSKQKGELRMDSPKSLLKGGENGAIIVKGNAGESEMYRRLILPEHDDDHMPPKEKPQLSDEEVALIEWWIVQGEADFDKKVAQVPQEEKIKTLLAHFTGEPAEAASKEAGAMDIPDLEVAAANPADIAALQEMDIVLTLLSPEKAFMAVNLVNVSHFSDEHMKALLKLEEQILWLDFSGSHITDEQLQEIGKFKNLSRLSLDNTPITDKGLAQLKDLPNLLYLNLYGTNITDQGLKSLESCKKLKTLYLWLTKVTPEGINALQQILGDETEINYGSKTEVL